MHGRQDLSERDGSETSSVIGHSIRNDQFIVVDESATGINNIRHVTFAFALVGFDQGFPQSSDNLARIVAIKQERADAVLAHRANPVAQDQPAGVGLHGGPAVPKLNQFPRENRFKDQFAFIPEVDVVGKHDVDVLVVLAGEHGIEAVDFPREEGHTFVFGGRTIQSNESKKEEVGRFYQLRHDHFAIEGSEGSVVDVSAVIVLETNKPCVLNTVPLRGSSRENNALRQVLVRLELHFVVGASQHPNSLCDVLIVVHHSIRQAELLQPKLVHFGFQIGAQLFQPKRLPEFVYHPLAEFAGQSQLKEFPRKQRLLVL